jgi:seryl-tRNA synthetase
MINLEEVRQSPAAFRESLEKRGDDPKLIDQLLEIDRRWRETIAQSDQLRAERNVMTKTPELAQLNAKRLAALKAELHKLEADEKKFLTERQQLWQQLPNLLDPAVPVGPGESANQVLSTHGQIKLKSGRSHEELMTKLDWLDLTAASRVSGSRFRYLKNEAAHFHLKLVLAALEFAQARGFQPIIPPILVKEEILEQAGYFPFGRDDTYAVEENLYLSGTSEYPLVALNAGAKLTAEQLPLRLVGFSSCFRRESGSYGQDVRGMFRQHQFDKVELVSLTRPEDSAAEHDFLLKTQQAWLDRFDLPYQTVLIGSGDLEKKAVKRFDLETWFPAQGRYRETHSVSNCTDYQARGLAIKYQNADGELAEVHTLNGTLATERLLLALVENHQTADGTVKLPVL